MSDLAATVDMRAELVEYPVGTELDRVCLSCGKPYVWVSEPGRRRATIYCSRPCRRHKTPERRVHRVALTEEHPEAAEGLTLLICARCWLPFGWAPHEERADDSPPLYHSRSCRYAAIKDRRKRRRAAEEEARRERRELQPEPEPVVSVVSAAVRGLLLPATHCLSCGKVASPTKEAAKEAKRAIEQRSGRTNEVRYYQCEDGYWHWTRQVIWGLT